MADLQRGGREVATFTAGRKERQEREELKIVGEIFFGNKCVWQTQGTNLVWFENADKMLTTRFDTNDRSTGILIHPPK
jgi:hypothetical protein